MNLLLSLFLVSLFLQGAADSDLSGSEALGTNAGAGRGLASAVGCGRSASA